MKWLDKYEVVNEGDIADLERSAANITKNQNLPQDQIEKQVYHDYIQKNLNEGIKHHFKKFQNNLDKLNKERHYAMFATYSSKLNKTLVKAALDLAKGWEGPKERDYTPHPFDSLVFNKQS